MDIFLWLLIGTAIGGGVAFFLLKQRENTKLVEEEKKLLELQQHILKAESEVKDKRSEAKDIIHEAKTQANEIKIELEKEKSRIEEKEQYLEKRELELDKKFSSVEEYKERLAKKEEDIESAKEEMKQALNAQKTKLEEIARMSQDEAKEKLLGMVEQDTKNLLLKQIERTELELKEDAKKKAQKIICQAIQRYGAEVASENMTTTVELANDELKGRIIGREGRNINAIEHITGVDVIVDDTPNAIMISGFDLVRRYMAKTLIEKLVEDGRIHPARIEEMFEKVKQETNELLKDFGEKALLEIGVSGIHPDLVKILGRLRFRTSYGQNQLKHAVEVAYICSAMAAEIGVDEEKAKLAGLFHDIGKAIDHEIEGSHAMIGYEVLKKYGIDEQVAYAVGAHHEDMPIQSALDYIVCAADAISGARPGARRESMEAYVKRLKELESIATSFEGVDKAFAIQAGREVRVMVNPAVLDDYETKKLTMNIAQKIEKDMTYPGQIKVHVIRESREIEFAK